MLNCAFARAAHLKDSNRAPNEMPTEVDAASIPDEPPPPAEKKKAKKKKSEKDPHKKKKLKKKKKDAADFAAAAPGPARLSARARARLLCRVMELRISITRYYSQEAQYMDRVRSRVAMHLGAYQGMKRVIQVRFNMIFPRARVPETASTRRERSER